MSIRAALLLSLTLAACTPPAPKAPEPLAADAAPDEPDAPAAAPDQGSAKVDETIDPPLEPAGPDLPFEDPPVAEGVVWLRLYPGYSESSKITVKRIEAGEGEGSPEVKLHATTDASSPVVGVIQYAVGELVRWRDTRVIVEPRVFIARRDVTIKGLRLAKPEVPGVGEEVADIKVKRGDKMLLYYFGDPPSCYMGRPGGPMLYGPCPDHADFDNPTKPAGYIMAPLEPERATWWLLVQRGDKVGWMRVDGRRFSHETKY